MSEKNNLAVNTFHKGLFTDVDPIEQPPGTYRYAHCAVSESREGESSMISTELSNEECAALPAGYIPVGNVGISNGRTAVFMTSPETGHSEIGTLKDCKYTKFINDADIEGFLNFGIYSGVDATWRLVKGCEDRVYFVTPTPMVVDLSGNTSYSDVNDFSLSKTYKSIPTFEKLEVTEAGSLPAGSYNVAVQLLDEDLNPTEWMTVSHVVNIYNDNLSKKYSSIRGSSTEDVEYRRFSDTNKAIRVTLGNLDNNFIFYRLAILQASIGTGTVNKVFITPEQPVDNSTFVYTGLNAVESEITELEVRAFSTVITKAKHIEQIGNRLQLSNVEYADINFCSLQRYASRINADAVTKEIDLNTLKRDNPKFSTLHYFDSNTDGTGYMPGEVYSFGVSYKIRYIPTGAILSSPAYHIPGKAPEDNIVIYDNVTNSYPMSGVDNQCTQNVYTDNGNCEDFWGCDSRGVALKNTPVRHHRFPLRSDHDIPFVEKVDGADVNREAINLIISGTPDPLFVEQHPTVTVAIGYGGRLFDLAVDLNTYDPAVGINVLVDTVSAPANVDATYSETGSQGGIAFAPNNTPAPSGLTYNFRVQDAGSSAVGDQFKGHPFGIHFSNIEVPSVDNTDYEVIGYDIVRQERTDENKTIVDSAVVMPITTDQAVDGIYESFSHILPVYTNGVGGRIKEDAVAFISPSNMFLNKEDRNVSEFIRQGDYVVDNRTYSSIETQDVGAGSSYDPEAHKRRENDSDGFDMQTLVREAEVSFDQSPGATPFGDINTIDYLKALEGHDYTDTDNNRKSLYNVSSDNKIGIATLKDKILLTEITDKLPYVYLKKAPGCLYTNFRTQPYFRETQNTIYFGNSVDPLSVSIWHGDIYITPIRFFNSMYYDFRIRNRKTKSGILNIVAGVLIAAAAIILAIPSGGTSLVAGAAAIATTAAASIAVGFGLSQIASGIRKEQVGKVYQELYEDGLRDTIEDYVTDAFFNYNNPDDQMQWQGECVTNLWFESPVNMALRQGVTAITTDFLDAPASARASHGHIVSGKAYNAFIGGGGYDAYNEANPAGELDEYFLRKLTNIDFDQSNGYLYQGYADAEIYSINKDYLRRNTQKQFSAIGLEYDCCSGCSEKFPHRVHASEVSFQEELTDNYRTFLPNNYRDMDGETGVITDMFKIQNGLFIHTEDALWVMRQNVQERVTDEIVSFIGTGEFFSIDPVKITDDEDTSAGTVHKWATEKTRNGAFFVSEKDKKVYNFNGKSLSPISDAGEFSWFMENTKLRARAGVEELAESEHSIFNAPFHTGFGYTSTYDYRLERFILTKRDAILEDEQDTKLWVGKNHTIAFPRYDEILAEQAALGNYYRGIIDGNMVFSTTESIPRTYTIWLVIGGLRIEQTRETIVCGEGKIYITGEVRDVQRLCDTSWTKSWAAKDNMWTGYHPYRPGMYYRSETDFFSFYNGKSWKHNIQGSYQTFYNEKYPFIVEEVQRVAGLGNNTWENIAMQTQASRYQKATGRFIDQRYITFDKVVAYNRRQSTGMLTILVKDVNADSENYLQQQITDTIGSVIADRNERDWSINNIRDYVVDCESPLFLEDCYLIGTLDKVPNPAATSALKDWTELEFMRDKYLCARYYFTNFEDVKLVVNYMYHNTINSLR